MVGLVKKLAAPSAFDYGSKSEAKAVGSSGTDIIGGLFREEFLQELTGSQAAVVYDQMRRRESQVAMLLDAIKNPIISGHWCFKVEDEKDPEQAKMKELCEWNFMHGLAQGWQQFLREVFTFIDFGHSVFETVHASEELPKLGLVTYFKHFGFRSQKTIHRWKLERSTGRIIAIEQLTTGDVSQSSLVDIPGEFLLVFTNKKEGDNYEGISALRPMYGAYKRKDLYLRLSAIGVERNALGTPLGVVPKGKENSPEHEELKAILEAYTSNELSYITQPEGWEVSILEGKFDPAKIIELLRFENTEMINAVCANFLALGTGGNGGSYSLGQDLSDFFLSGIQAYANLFCDIINRFAVPALMRMNYGEVATMPKLECSGINDKAGKELAEVIGILVDKNVIRPDMPLEEFMRSIYKVTPPDESTVREKPAAPSPFGGQPGSQVKPAPDSNAAPASGDATDTQTQYAERMRAFKLSDTYAKDMARAHKEIKPVMEENITLMAASIAKQLRSNWEALPDSSKLNATKDVYAKGLPAYKAAVREALTPIANQALVQARREVPKAARAAKFSDYSKLNPLVRRAIESQLNLVVDAQAADLEKIMLFQFSSSAASQTSIDGIMNDVDARVKAVLAGEASSMNIEVAAGNLAAQITQNTRNAFFFEPEVLASIESFTFTNEDPVSDICQNLAGQTFLATDPAAEQYYPPLHHLCKSRIVPNGKDEGVPVTGLNIIADSTEERARLEKQITFCEHR